MFHALAVPGRRGLRDDGAEDGGGAEEDEGAAHRALPCLCGGIGGFRWASQMLARVVSKRLPRGQGVRVRARNRVRVRVTWGRST